MMDKTWLQRCGGTRFVMCLGCGVMTTALQWFVKLDPAGLAYSGVILGTVGAYITGNLFQSRAETFAKRDVEVAQVKVTTGDSQQ
jgi:hypothetical protein